MLATDRRDWRHVALDPNQARRFHDCGLQLIAEAGLSPFVEHVNGESQLVLPQFVANGRTFDFAVVDVNHRFDRVFPDLIYLGRLLLPASVVYIDDYQLPAIRKACDFCLRNLDWSFKRFPQPTLTINGQSCAPLRTLTPARSITSWTSNLGTRRNAGAGCQQSRHVTTDASRRPLPAHGRCDSSRRPPARRGKLLSAPELVLRSYSGNHELGTSTLMRRSA